ncbi:hypothetical protein [Microbacterium capsulatum]|uniref:Lipoprotein n=1 Tax=Microbacterium capsulatum TaxID=3041921 RepID=A0ABU0XHE8_9MICO|nr:hypothetical protein [Microbacterium sp. ASV81]MDQ4214557.1 hypothetical protein [Microbacterium sp. ASV81]
MTISRAAATWRGLQLAAFAAAVACVVLHAALTLTTGSPTAVVMTGVAAACGLCLRPRRSIAAEAAWGSALAMSAGMLLFHVWSAGAGEHRHRAGASVLGAGPAAASGGALHTAAIACNGLELALVMAAAIAIGVRRRRGGSRPMPA